MIFTPNFDVKIGKTVSRGHAMDKIWALEGYLLQEKLWQTSQHEPTT